MDFNFITDTPKTNIEMLLNHIYAKSGNANYITISKRRLENARLQKIQSE